MQLDVLIHEIKQAAQQELMPRFAKVKRRLKLDGSIVTDADLAMQKRLGDYLLKHTDHALLAEEMSEQEQQQALQAGEAIWCLDPLDGTSNFASGVPYFAVSLSLIKSEQVQLGIVYDPNRDECFVFDGEKAWCNDETISLQATGLVLDKSIGLVDLKRLPKLLASRLACEPPFASQRSFGSVALDWCWIAMGRCQIYLHGKQNLWDYGAGHAVFMAAGGYSCTLDGAPIHYQALRPLAAVGAVDADLFVQWCEALGIKKTPK